MFDDLLPEPTHESDTNYQLYHQLKSLEEGARAEFEHALTPRNLVELGGMHNSIVATFEVKHNHLNFPVAVTLTVAYDTVDHYRHGYEPHATVNARLNPGEEAVTIGTLDNLLVNDSAGQDVDVIVEWTPDDDIPFPAAPTLTHGPIERPQAVIDEYIDRNAGFLSTTARDSRSQPATSQMFHLRLTNYGVAKVIPTNRDEAAAEVDISTASYGIEDSLHEAMDRRVRLALEQQGEVPPYLLTEDDR